jgi:hypothetical protein
MYAAAFRNCLHVPSYWLCEPSAASGSSVRVPFRLSSRLRTRPNAWNQNGSTVCVTALRHHSFAMTCVALSHASRISRKTPGEIHARWGSSRPRSGTSDLRKSHGGQVRQCSRAGWVPALRPRLPFFGGGTIGLEGLPGGCSVRLRPYSR